MLFSIYETFGSLGKQIGFGSHPFSRASVLSVNSLLTAEQLQVLGEEHITKRLLTLPYPLIGPSYCSHEIV